VAELSSRQQPPRPSCLVKYNNILLPTDAVKFHIIIGHLCLFCRPHDGSVLNALLGKWIHRHPIASTLRTSLDAWINAWGSVSDLHTCVGFRGNKKVEKHCCIHLSYMTLSAAWSAVIVDNSGLWRKHRGHILKVSDVYAVKRHVQLPYPILSVDCRVWYSSVTVACTRLQSLWTIAFFAVSFCYVMLRKIAGCEHTEAYYRRE